MSSSRKRLTAADTSNANNLRARFTVSENRHHERSNESTGVLRPAFEPDNVHMNKNRANIQNGLR
jgi:hypothetical protein